MSSVCLAFVLVRACRTRRHVAAVGCSVHKPSCADTLAAAWCARVPPAPPAAQLNAWKDVMGSYIRSREFSDDVARLQAQETR